MKDAYYFSHDANARHDPKCQMLVSKFGMEGYGVFWVIVETMREQDEYKYPINFADAISMDCKCNAKAIIDYCIEIGLFITNGEYFQAPGLLKRMQHLDAVRNVRAKAASERWKKTKVKYSKVKESKVKGMHSKCNANAMQMQTPLTPFGTRLKTAFSSCKNFPVPTDKNLSGVQDQWETLYSDRDIEREITKADAWCANNARHKLTFISSWLDKANTVKPKSTCPQL